MAQQKTNKFLKTQNFWGVGFVAFLALYLYLQTTATYRTDDKVGLFNI